MPKQTSQQCDSLASNEECWSENIPKLAAVVEAVLFAAANPVSAEELAEVCQCSAEQVRLALAELSCSLQERGLILQRIAGSYQLATAREYSKWVERYLRHSRRVKLNRAQTETLAVVAYNQPVTRAVVDGYRGVHCERILEQLQELNLIRELGRASSSGRPILYGTTPEFLRYFALNSLEDLPELSSSHHTAPGEGITQDRAPVAESNIAPNVTKERSDDLLDAPSEGLQKLFAKLRRQRDHRVPSRSE